MNEPFGLHHLQIQLFYIFQKLGDQKITRALWFTAWAYPPLGKMGNFPQHDFDP